MFILRMHAYTVIYNWYFGVILFSCESELLSSLIIFKWIISLLMVVVPPKCTFFAKNLQKFFNNPDFSCNLFSVSNQVFHWSR